LERQRASDNFLPPPLPASSDMIFSERIGTVILQTVLAKLQDISKYWGMGLEALIQRHAVYVCVIWDF